MIPMIHNTLLAFRLIPLFLIVGPSDVAKASAIGMSELPDTDFSLHSFVLHPRHGESWRIC